jgi:hypothetical protein
MKLVGKDKWGWCTGRRLREVGKSNDAITVIHLIHIAGSSCSRMGRRQRSWVSLRSGFSRSVTGRARNKFDHVPVGVKKDRTKRAIREGPAKTTTGANRGIGYFCDIFDTKPKAPDGRASSVGRIQFKHDRVDGRGQMLRSGAMLFRREHQTDRFVETPARLEIRTPKHEERQGDRHREFRCGLTTEV